jgi:hypothetical protein
MHCRSAKNEVRLRGGAILSYEHVRKIWVSLMMQGVLMDRLARDVRLPPSSCFASLLTASNSSSSSETDTPSVLHSQSLDRLVLLVVRRLARGHSKTQRRPLSATHSSYPTFQPFRAFTHFPRHEMNSFEFVECFLNFYSPVGP